MSAPSATPVRARARVEGIVQGVGFRPYVFRLARSLALDGWVLNDEHGVVLEVEGPAAAVEEFFGSLARSPPPLALVERVVRSEAEPGGEPGFAIRESLVGSGPADAPVTADTATCADCLGELLDPADRRYRYPFINCTNCGPRFTIVRGVPYDRPLTTMAGFAMCEACRGEYGDPADRRFHAQPNACPRCGPAVRLLDAAGAAVGTGGARDPIAAAALAVMDGAIVALKGVGGYHLACRADDEAAVARLRARKHREDKPFALMAPHIGAVEALVVLDGPGRELLQSPARPIVLAPRRSPAPVAPSVAPGAPELGVMLPYSPLHHLLLADAGTALVMTSGNVSDEPICFDDGDALARLRPIADRFLIHDRPIETRTDDSVVRVIAHRPAILRRSRGYVPASLPLPHGGTAQPLLACGGELKNTFCLAQGRRAWVSHHVGDLEELATYRSFVEGIEHFQRLFAVAPRLVVHDLHPEYLSTKYALERGGVQTLAVQHHHAHLAACLAEHRVDGPAVGAIYDGAGYGLDGTIWGGEILFGNLAGFTRVGALRAVALPGGETAVRQPWRMACAWLTALAGEPPPVPGALSRVVDADRWAQVARLAGVVGGVAAPATTSVGRLFDAVAALCGVRAAITYEGQAAIELEACCDPLERSTYPVDVRAEAGRLVLDPAPALRAIEADLARGEPVGRVASRFHAGLARGTVEALVRAAGSCGTDLAVLSGGVFANRRLLEATAAGAAAAGLRVLRPERLPAGDGGLSYGQAAVGARSSLATVAA